MYSLFIRYINQYCPEWIECVINNKECDKSCEYFYILSVGDGEIIL